MTKQKVKTASKQNYPTTTTKVVHNKPNFGDIKLTDFVPLQTNEEEVHRLLSVFKHNQLNNDTENSTPAKLVSELYSYRQRQLEKLFEDAKYLLDGHEYKSKVLNSLARLKFCPCFVKGTYQISLKCYHYPITLFSQCTRSWVCPWCYIRAINKRLKSLDYEREEFIREGALKHQHWEKTPYYVGKYVINMNLDSFLSNFDKKPLSVESLANKLIKDTGRMPVIMQYYDFCNEQYNLVFFYSNVLEKPTIQEIVFHAVDPQNIYNELSRSLDSFVYSNYVQNNSRKNYLLFLLNLFKKRF